LDARLFIVYCAARNERQRISEVEMKMGSGKIMWVASYPKSGNTWMRAFLANYLINRPPGTPLPLTELQNMTMSDSGANAIGKFSERDHLELSAHDLFAARLRYLEEVAARPTPTFVKTHMPNATMFEVPILPPELSRCAVYLVRNPLDVVISYSHHMTMDLEKSAEAMAKPGNVIGGSEKQIRQFVGHWSLHVQSWRSVEAFPVLQLRYEDMIDDPERSFASVIESIGAPLDKARLQDAIEATSFEKLQAKEAAEGFNERGEKQERFFRAGKKNQWQDILPQPIVDKVMSDHGEVMRELGYL
jgi:hypothetical protein